jgi:hypothetical protein
MRHPVSQRATRYLLQSRRECMAYKKSHFRER